MTKARSFTGTEARLMLRRARAGTLATINRGDGIPYGSLVNVATDCDGRPILLLSALAWHAQNLLADARASILVAEPAATGDALTGPRVTVLGRLVRCREERFRRRFLARHPAAAIYADFGDFGYWRLEPETVHAVAGFGRIETLPPAEVFPPVESASLLAESATAELAGGMTDAARLYAAHCLARAGDWRIAAIDGDGADLVLGTEALRLPFPATVGSSAELENCFAALAAEARSAKSG